MIYIFLCYYSIIKPHYKEVSRVIVKDGNSFLLGKRTSSGLWVILGGKRDFKIIKGFKKKQIQIFTEIPKQTARREFLEESGYKAEKLQLLFTDTFGDWLTYYYLCTKLGKQIQKPDAEHSLVTWVPFSKLSAKNMGQNHYKILQRVMKNIENQK